MLNNFKDQEADLLRDIQDLKNKAENKKLQMHQFLEDNSIKQEQWIKLKVKQTALRKELSALNLNKQDHKEEKKQNKKKEGDDDDDDDDENDQSNSVDPEDVELKDKEDGDDLKELNAQQLLRENTWYKLVQEKIKELIDTEIVVLRQDFKENLIGSKPGAEGGGGQGASGANQGDGTQIRSYINNVTIKVNSQDITNAGKRAAKNNKSNKDFMEQKFKVTKDTSFFDMRDEACGFWGLTDVKEEFTLVLPNMHDIMSLNKEESHIAHSIAQYFEIHRAKRAVLMLVRPETSRQELYPEEGTYIQVKGAKKTKRFDRGDKRSFEDIQKAQDKKNLDMFFDKYPGLEEELISDMTQFNRNKPGRLLIENPDLSFCNFLISLCMFTLSLYTFYNDRDFNNEYFNRQLITQKLMHNPLGFQNFMDIKSVEDLTFFMNTTVAEQLFESEQSRIQKGQPGYDADYKTPYIFNQGIVPLGKLRIRQQRRKIIDCVDINEKIVKLRKNPVSQIQCLNPSTTHDDQDRTTITAPSSTKDEEWHTWRSATELKSTGAFYTDEISDSGDGYIQDFSMGLSSKQFANQIDSLLTYQTPRFINPQVSLMLINFNCYEPSEDRFISTQLSIEFSMAGVLLPRQLKCICFSLDQVKQISKQAFAVDMVQFFLCSCIFVRVVFLKIMKYNEPDIEGYSKGCSIGTDVLVILCFMLKFYFSQQTNGHDLAAILNDTYETADDKQEEKYIEMIQYANYYMEQYQCYTLIIIFNLYNLVSALRIFRLVHWIMLILERTFYVVFLFMMLLVPLQIGFAFLSYVFAGPYLKKYDSIINGIKQQIITMMGQQDSMALMRNNYNFTIIWTMVFIVFFAYFFVSASIVAFEDGFDQTVNEHGYPSDFEYASQWSPKEYIIWAISWMPEPWFKEVVKRLDYEGKGLEREKSQDDKEKKDK